MADTPIDINSNRKSVEKNEELKEALYKLFTLVSDAQNKMNMRIEDLVKDTVDLNTHVSEIIVTLYEKWPELAPELEGEEDEE